MSTALHRKDMSSEDFQLLAWFSWLYQQAKPDYDDKMYFGTIYLLGMTTMLLPVWFKTGNSWKIANIKQFDRDAVGIETGSLRNMCRYIGVSESRMIDTLFRFSMLSVIPGQKYYDPPKFRMPFFGDIKGYEGYAPPCNGVGFVIERRRLEGNFKSEVGNGK